MSATKPQANKVCWQLSAWKWSLRFISWQQFIIPVESYWIKNMVTNILTTTITICPSLHPFFLLLHISWWTCIIFHQHNKAINHSQKNTSCLKKILPCRIKQVLIVIGMVLFQGTHDQKVSLSEREQITCGQRIWNRFLYRLRQDRNTLAT